MAEEHTSTHSAPPAEGAPPRVFLTALEERRGEMFRYARQHPQSARIADFLFDVLTRLANKGQLDAASLNALCAQPEALGVPASEVEVRLPEGLTLSLEQALTFGAPPPSAHELLSALFALGFQQYIERKPAEERRALISRVVKLLPGVERLGPFVLTDFVDYACSEAEANKFWQLYVERVASEVGRRTAETEAEREAPTWVLSALLELHEGAPAALIGRRWELLRKHVQRISQCPQPGWRWRFMRVLAEPCQDERLLYFMCTTPSVMEDDAVPLTFLTRCNHKLISCALFMLQVGRGSREVVAQALSYFEEHPLIDIGERAVEIYAQIQLVREPSSSLVALRDALLSIITHKLKTEPADVLLSAIKNDARAFRQCALLIDAVPTVTASFSSAETQLLERVLQSFFHAFTPSGVLHPLNDRAYQEMITRAVVALMRSPDPSYAATLSSFASGLAAEAQRWLPEPEDEQKRKLLLTHFLGQLAHVLRLAARRLYKSPELRPRARALYLSLLNLYIANPDEALDSGGYGALVPLLSSLYPDILSREHLTPPAEERLHAVAALYAQIEDELAPSAYLGGVVDEWRERNRGRELVAAPAAPAPAPAPAAPSAPAAELQPARTKALVPVTTHAPIRAPITFVTRRPAPSTGALRAYLGLDVLSYLGRRALELLGVRREGELVLSADQVAILEAHRDGDGAVLGRREVRFHPSQISGLALHQPLHRFYYVFGLMSLVSLSLVGGYLVFAGLRGAEHGLAALGAAAVGVGLLVDAAMSRRASQGARRVLLEISRLQAPRPVVVSVDHTTPQGQTLINALASRAALQTEEEFQEEWQELSTRAAEARARAATRTREEEEAARAQAAAPNAPKDPKGASDPSDSKGAADPKGAKGAKGASDPKGAKGAKGAKASGASGASDPVAPLAPFTPAALDARDAGRVVGARVGAELSLAEALDGASLAGEPPPAQSSLSPPLTALDALPRPSAAATPVPSRDEQISEILSVTTGAARSGEVSGATDLEAAFDFATSLGAADGRDPLKRPESGEGR